ncbi:MAG: 1-acyl-sn-glycerol-3-phosphate acyltransferase [Desulfococcaceae bacterium]|jgi:glycerol-3-phosphate O-acyltransferase|nr:1-acyl-sn-glycerol-3-phosphate acyltransferase [Desulfococcaceae bacterium]
MFQKIKDFIRYLQTKTSDWTDTALEGTHHHYRCFFPRDRGKITELALRFIFSGIRLNEEQTRMIRELPEGAVPVYINKYKSDFEYLFYHIRYNQEGLPVPEIGFDYAFFWLQSLSRIFKIILSHILYFCKNFALPNPYSSDYIREELKAGRAAFLSLVEEKGFYLRFVKEKTDPLRYLIEMQKENESPLYLIPQLIFYSKKPRRATPGLMDFFFGSQENPGKIRRMFMILRQNENIFVEISEPVNLQEFITHKLYKELSSEEQALLLRRQLLIRLNRHRQSITGPLLKSRAELKENILTNKRLRSYMENYAETRKIPLRRARKEADGYIDEIAAKYSLNMIQIFSLVLRWVFGIMFEGISVNRDALQRIRTLSRKGPVVLVPCHKSHIDYLVISYLMYNNDMPCPYIAAGKNLSFWPMGPIFRNAGAFFIRRTFKGAVLYSKVFSEYIYKILEEGFNIEFFIEGGRSRTGKLLQPKLGFLSILLNAFKAGASEDLIFVPVFIGYDRVPEEGAYLRELEGGKKNPENLKQVIRARKFLRKRYGRIYIRFHEGILMSEVLAEKETPFQDMPSKEFNTLCRSLGHRIVNAIDRMSVITPHAIVASAILNTRRKRLSYSGLLADIETYMNYLSNQKAQLADTLLLDHVRAADYVMDNYIQRRFIEVIESQEEDDDEKCFVINPAKRTALEYYKNNCITAFSPAAFTALAVLNTDAFQFAGADLYESFAFLQDFFSNEFSSDAERPPEHYVHKNIKAFIDEAILMPHPSMPDRYNLTSAGFRKLKLFAAFLNSYFESYWITLHFFMRYPRNFVEPDNRIKKIQSMGNRMFRKKEVELPEALSRINYKNAADYFLSNGVKGSEDEEKIEFYRKKIRRYMELLQS